MAQKDMLCGEQIEFLEERTYRATPAMETLVNLPHGVPANS